MNNRNAFKGKEHEEIFAREIQRDPNTIRDIVLAFSQKEPRRQIKIRIVETEGQHGEKSDVFIRASGGYNFGVNIKSFKGTGFNQVTRMTIDNFHKTFGLTYRLKGILEESTIAKAKNRKKRWISESYAETVVKEIEPNAYKIIRHSLLGEDSPKLFVLIKSDDKIIWIYKMDDLLKYLEDSIDVCITRGGVIKLNECFSIQKKGGNGEHKKYSKTDLRHGGNNVQIKMKSGLLSSKLKPIATLEY